MTKPLLEYFSSAASSILSIPSIATATVVGVTLLTITFGEIYFGYSNSTTQHANIINNYGSDNATANDPESLATARQTTSPSDLSLGPTAASKCDTPGRVLDDLCKEDSVVSRKLTP